MEALVNAVVPFTNFVLLLAVGLDLTVDDFTRVRQQRAAVLAGLFAPLLILPAVAVFLINLFDVGAATASGVLLIAASPIGGISNAYSYLARAATALSVTLTGLSCLCASVTIPLISAGFELVLRRQFDFSAPLGVLFMQLTLMLALPVTLGMWLRRRSPEFATRYRGMLKWVAFLGVAVMFAAIIASQPSAFLAELSSTVPVATIFVLLSLGTGWLVGTAVSDDRRIRFTMAAEFGTRNIGVAITIAVTLLGRIEFARFATTYAFTEIPLLLAAVALFRWQTRSIPAAVKTW